MDPIGAPKELIPWLECAFYFVAFSGAVVWVVKQVRGEKPQPPNEQLKESQAELARRIQENEANQKALEARMLADKEQILASGSNRGKTIYAKIDDTRRELQTEVGHLRTRFEPVVENLACIKGQMEAFTQAFQQQTEALKAINAANKNK